MALPINIKDLINGKTVEWERIEFKEGYNPEDIIHSICAFANDLNNWSGGYVIIGFKEDAGRPVFPAIGLQESQLDAYQKKLIELCHQLDPFYFPQVQPYDYDGKMILVIWVPGGDNRPYKGPKTLGEKGQKYYYVRRTSNSVVANSTEEKQLLELAARIPFDDRISHFGKLTDIDLKLIQEHLREIGSDLLEESGKLSHHELCRKMEIARGPDESLRPLNIGLMLFSSQPDKHFKGAVIDVVIYSDNSGTKFIEKKFSGPLPYQLRNTLEFLKLNVIQEQVLKISNEEQAKRIVNYPFDAIEETLVNSVYHRSYEDDRHTEINIFKDRIEIISYPGPLPPVDQEALLQERVIARDYRNRRIGDYLKELKLSEGRATGIPTIRTKMREAGCPAPEFIPGKENSHFLTILKINSEWDQSINEKSDTIIIVLSNNEQIILERCLYETLTLDELYKRFSKTISKTELIKLLKGLKNEGLLVEKEIKKVLGLIKVKLFSTTPKGQEVLKKSF